MKDKLIYKILLIDDDEDEYFLFKDYLEEIDKDYEVDWIDNFDDALLPLNLNSYDLYFLDFYIGARTGLELLEAVSRDDRSSPVILLTGQGNKQVDQDSLKAGVADYIVKEELNANTLDRVIRYAISRHEAKKRIEEQRFKYISLFETSLDPIIICDLSFEVYECNKVFQELIGREISESDTVLMNDFVSEEDALIAFQDAIHKKGSLKNYSISIDSVKGPIDCLASVSKMLGFDKISKGYQIIFHDITEIREAQRQQHINEQLQMASRMAQMIAHEVRNPLTNIDLALEQLSDIELPEKEERDLYFDIIKRNSSRINALISQILDSSKPTKLHIQAAKASELIYNVLHMCKDRIDLSGVEVMVSHQDGDFLFDMDQEKLELALVNIVSNALEAMNQVEHPILQIETKKNNGGAIVCIEDNGRGMTDDQMNKIFEPFFTARRGGKGLGMTLSQNVVHSHGGNIALKSDLGEGTKFYISLPRLSRSEE